MPGLASSRGVSLVEALVAALLVATAIAGLVQLVALGAGQMRQARQVGTARILVESKLEELRALRWSYAADGTRLSSVQLSPSPDASLAEDRDGFGDRFDRFGAIVEQGDAAEFRRRWSITPVIDGDADTLHLQVCVFPLTAGPPYACGWTIRTRHP